MNETTIHGVLEVYSVKEAAKVKDVIENMEHNFFNLVYSNSYEQHTGSILIPFAKSMRADVDDLIFLEEKLTDMIRLFAPILLNVEVFLNTYHNGRFNYILLYTEGTLSWQKFKCERAAIASYDVIIDW